MSKSETTINSIAIVCGLLAAFSIICFILFGPSAIKIYRAHSWTETTCRIDPNLKRVGRGAEPPDLSYTYQVDGKEFRSDQIQFGSLLSLSAKTKHSMIKQYPPGTELPCYYNPTDPKEAVISREYNPEILFNIFPLLLLVVGLCGLALMLMLPGGGGGGAVLTEQQMVPVAPAPKPLDLSIATGVSSGPIRLGPKLRTQQLFLPTLALCLLWNGALVLTNFFAPVDLGEEGLLWAKIVFYILVLAGLALAIGAAVLYKKRRQPRIELTIGVTRLPLGGWTLVNWSITAGGAEIKDLQIYIEGVEELRLKPGRKEPSKRHVFARLSICSLNDPRKLQRGEAVIEIPKDMMHTFKGRSSQISWSLRADATIDGKRDIRERHPIIITPLHPEDIHT